MPRAIVVLLVITCVAVFNARGQMPARYTSGDIYQGLEKLQVLGSVLYVAAHPDDENTRLISHLANDRKLNTTYLSVTRGDGGQNLIGSEISELLGVIRTQELLQARRVDHGGQRFTRANDFGFSKTPEETLRIWNEQEVLSDMVWVIRTLQPDIIINRFMAQVTDGNHGHHVASAILSTKAFEAAADPTMFPEQLKYTKPWQASRIFFNTNWWFYGSRENFDQMDKSQFSSIDVGGFDHVAGWSNTEIAARSRTMHKSQGFGSTGTRGSEKEYLELLKGKEVFDQSNVFDQIDISWNRLPGGSAINDMIEKMKSEYDFQKPYLSIDAALAVRTAISKLSPSAWKVRKLAEADFIIAQMLGLFMEADAAVFHAAPGDSVSLNLEIINRSEIPVKLLETTFASSGASLDWQSDLGSNKRLTALRKVFIPLDEPKSTPYWLEQPGTIGLYAVDNQELRGLPETPRTVVLNFLLQIENDTVTYTVPVIYKENDPVDGESYRPFEVVPPVFVNIASPAYIFNGTHQKQVDVKVKAATIVSGTLALKAPAGWNVTPAQMAVSLAKAGDEEHYHFSLSPSENAEDGYITAVVETQGRFSDQMLTEITYDHIPAQTVLRPSTAKVVYIDLKVEGQRIAYIQGAGDDIAPSLEQIGYSVDILSLDDITTVEALQRYDAIIFGIRAYNTLERIRFVQPQLFAYVERGGTLITQYNTSNGLHTEQLAPVPLKIGRKRVTDEHAEVTFLNPEHVALNTPNKLTSADFEGWVQERGLYFADTWDPAFEPLLALSDPGEDPLPGGLLVAKHGKGYFVYTSLSFFRQLPDGVPGAYRLFANLIALGQNGKS